ncbi:MAG: hypothetical protein AABY22_15915 [Nanoarchaeota archaeon]
MSNTIQINSIKRAIGQLTMRIGVMQVRDAISDFTDEEGDFNRFKKPLLDLPVAELDSKYYFTSWENWEKVIATINPILEQFNWKQERFDCDDRALLVTALTALFFEINTVRPLYCDVYRVGDGQFAFTHYANVIVDINGNAWLWDVDEFGKFTKITSNNVIINNKRYVLKAIK